MSVTAENSSRSAGTAFRSGDRPAIPASNAYDRQSFRSRSLAFLGVLLSPFRRSMMLLHLIIAPLSNRSGLWALSLWSRSKASVLWQKASLLHQNYGTTRNIAELTEAIGCYRMALQSRPPDDLRCQICINLANALRERYQEHGEHNDLHESVKVSRDAWKIAAVASDDQISACLVLSEALRLRSFEYNDNVDLTESLYLIEGINPLVPIDHSQRRSMLYYHSQILRERARRTRSAEDLEQAMLLARDAIALNSPGQISEARPTCCLASILRDKFVAGGRLTYLEEAIALCNRIVDVSTEPDTVRAQAYTVLGACLFSRYGQLRDLDALPESIKMHRTSLALQHPGNPQRAASLTNLGGSLYKYAERHDDSHSADEAIMVLREALALSQRANPNIVHTLLNLSAVLRYCFAGFTGANADLDECIALRYKVQEFCSPSDDMHATALYHCADGLYLRYFAFGYESDLMESIVLYKQTLLEQKPGDPARSRTVSFLGRAVTALFGSARSNAHGEQNATMQETISLLRDANLNESMTSEGKIWLLIELGLALLAWHVKTSDEASLDEALQYLDQSVQLEPSDSVLYPGCLICHADGLMARYRLRHDTEDLILAADRLSAASNLFPKGKLEHAECLCKLSELHLEPEPAFYNPKEALRYLIKGLQNKSTNTPLRVNNALQVLEKLRGLGIQELSPYLEPLTEAYSTTVQLLPQVAFFGMKPESRLHSLAKAETTATDGAVCALSRNLSEMAVELLEQGRSLFWSQTLRLRTSFEDVPDHIREEALALARLLELESLSPSGADMTERRQRSERFEDMLQHIRSLPGLDRFMLPEQFSSLARAALAGPVVVLVGSDLGCSAIVLQNVSAIIQVRLKDITMAWLTHAAETWKLGTEATRATEATDAEPRLKMEKTRRRMYLAEQQIDLLTELWNKVVKPVFDQLDLVPRQGRDRPRMWWCTTGPFTFLPVHAAGAYPHGPCCSDFVVSSYTPTIGALLTARDRYKLLGKKEARVLIAGVPHAMDTSWAPLPSIVDEANAIKASVPPHALCSVPPEDDVLSGRPNAGMSTQTLLTELSKSASILHLACHGSQDVANPLESGFVLRDGTLTISKLMPVPLTHVFFAFLSACETAKGDKEQPDQTVHLAATMLFIGFKSVIATLWSMDDCDGPVVAKEVYQALFGGDGEYLDPDSIPYALDDAVQQLRRSGASPSRWAPYVHIGI